MTGIIKRWIMSIVMASALAVIGASSVAIAQHYPPEPPSPTYEIEVQQPAPEVEVRPMAPRPYYDVDVEYPSQPIYVLPEDYEPGHWEWDGDEWEWED